MNKFKNCDCLKSYLNKESKRLNISITNVYNTFFSRDLLYRLSKIDKSMDIIVKGSFAQAVHLGKIVRPITDIDLTSTIDHHDPLILLIHAMCDKEGNNDFDYKLREESRRTNTGIIKFPIAAKYGKINHPIGIDYRENHPCIYEKQLKLVPKVFSKDEEYEVVVPSMEETLAEKLCIIAESTKTDVLNTRTKDFYDIYHLHGGDYDLDKFSYYFEKMLQDRGKVRDIYSLNTDYLNNDFIERHESVWESNKRHYEFLDDEVDLKGAVYYTKSTLKEQFQRIGQGKNKVYKI